MKSNQSRHIDSANQATDISMRTLNKNTPWLVPIKQKHIQTAK